MRIFHHNDHDGRCAAAIFKKTYPKAVCLEITHDRPIPLDGIDRGEGVIIVDFTLQPEAMEWIVEKTKRICWIDHHKTARAFEKGYEKRGWMKFIGGLREYKKRAACELAWEYLFSDQATPRGVMMISDYDTWSFKHRDTRAFNEGLKCQDTAPWSTLWKSLLDGPSDWLIQKICQDGVTCLKYRDQWCKDYRKRFGFETTLDGYRCYAMNLAHMGSPGFGEKIEEYDIVIAFTWNGNTWSISLYTTLPSIDVSEIAKRHGGGGHKGSAGFEVRGRYLPVFLRKEK